MTEGDGLTLEKAMTLARTFEQTQESAAMMNSSTSSVSKIVHRQSKKPSTPKSKSKKDNSDQKCFACGKTGQFRSAPECKTKNVTCRFCTKKGHFDSVCTKKLAQKSTVQDPGHASTKHIIADQQLYGMIGKIGDLHSHSWLLFTQRDGVDLQMQVDTRSKFCIIPFSSLMVIGESKHQLKPAMNFEGYGQKSLSCIGMFTAKLGSPGRHIKTDFYVMEEDDTPLMGLLAARDLGLIDAKINSLLKLLYKSSKANVQDSESSTRMPDTYQMYPQLFSESLETIKNFSYDIQIDPNATTIAQKERVPAYAVQSWTEAAIQKMLSLGVFEECTESHWISPIHVVLNESKERCLTIDLRLVNKSIIRHHYPMPKVQDLLVQFSDSNYFSKLDLRKRYWQIELTDETCHITTFAVFGHLFRFKRLPFGIKGASGAMDLLMNLVLQGLDGVAKLQDDVDVHGRTREEHDKRLSAVLDPMAEHGVTLNIKNCEFLKHEIKILGHIFGDTGVSADPGKVEAITDMPRPTTVSQLRSFRSSISFLQHYTPNMASLLEPLHKLNRKNTRWKRNTEHEAAFRKAKPVICNSPCLTLYQTEAEHKLVVDGSPSASSAVLCKKRGKLATCI